MIKMAREKGEHNADIAIRERQIAEIDEKIMVDDKKLENIKSECQRIVDLTLKLKDETQAI